MEYARIAARHFGTEHHEYYVTPDDVVAAIPLIAAAYDQPFGNASAVPTYYCASWRATTASPGMLGGRRRRRAVRRQRALRASSISFALYERIPGIAAAAA